MSTNTRTKIYDIRTVIERFDPKQKTQKEVTYEFSTGKKFYKKKTR